jgi:hypothetical protein
MLYGPLVRSLSDSLRGFGSASGVRQKLSLDMSILENPNAQAVRRLYPGHQCS